jgi:hypothetical protein
MAKHQFTATHGVHLWDLGAHFKKSGQSVDEDGRGHAVYSFETDDDKVAAALAKVEGYGIEKVKPAKG